MTSTRVMNATASSIERFDLQSSRSELVRGDKKIQILRSSRFGVNAESVASDYEIPNPVIVERA
jgi:hypothetical protein